ncbi:MAG: methyltransferase domain-containing protein [bacterium]|nr:methyltransferase domain-containing protein [bacterium]
MADAQPSAAPETLAYLRDGAGAGIDAVDASSLVYGPDGRPARLGKEGFEHLVRKLEILRWLERLPVESFLEVGAGLDHVPCLVRERHGADAYYADVNHAVTLPGGTERLGKLDHGVTLDVSRLPFADDSFDVVLASEVLEHLVRPVEALAELVRVARRAVVMTSLEALAPGRLARLLAHLRIDTRVPHVERNFFLAREFHAFFGADLRHEALFSYLDAPASPFWPRAWIDAAFAAIQDVDALVAALVRAATPRPHGPGTMGILLVKVQPGTTLRPPLDADAERALARWLIGTEAELERESYELLASHAAWTLRPELRPATPPPAPDRRVAAALLGCLRCPDCRGPLAPAPMALRCAPCGTAFPTEQGVPILFPTRAHDGLDEAVRRLCGDDAARARVVRRLAARLRRNERPPGVLRRAFWGLDRLVVRAAG